MNAPGMSTVITRRRSRASTILVKKSASTVTVGELVSSFVLYRRCFRPSTHPRPLILPHRFSFRNMRYFKAAFFCSRVKVFAILPSITFRYMSCSSSTMIAFSPLSPNNLRPFCALICSVMSVTMSHGSFTCVISCINAVWLKSWKATFTNSSSVSFFGLRFFRDRRDTLRSGFEVAACRPNSSASLNLSYKVWNCSSNESSLYGSSLLSSSSSLDSTCSSPTPVVSTDSALEFTDWLSALESSDTSSAPTPAL